MLSSRSHRCVARASLLAAVLAAPAAHAQETIGNFNLNQLDPSPAGDDFFALPSAYVAGHLEPRAYLMFDYSVDPLVVGGTDKVVAGQGFLRANGSIAFFGRLLIGVDIPAAIVQTGDSPVISSIPVASPDSAEMGDVRLDVRASLYGKYRDPFQVGLGTRFYFPTAGSDSLAGEGKPRVMPQAAASGHVGDEHAFIYTASFGWMARGPENPHALNYGVAAGGSFLDDMFQVQAELHGSTLLTEKPALRTERIVLEAPTTTSLELLGGAKVRVVRGLTFGAAAGPGLTDGIGTPTLRALGMIGWAPVPERDRSAEDDDRDGVANGKDACKLEKGEVSDDPAKNGCPPGDRDGDTIADGLDACPSLKGRPNADLTRNGCPSDYDRDGIADSDDACPNQRGVASSDPQRNGCPGDLDTDLDGIADRSDACPKDKGSRNDEPSKNGCPTQDGDGDNIPDRFDACPNERGLPDLADRSHHGCPKQVRVTTGEIVILRQVTFKLGQSSLDQTVDPVSDDLLTEVRDVILQHPEIEIIEVQGHADDTGTAEFNTTLSQQRADAVRKWLSQRGIDAKRLTARGYGSTIPIATNQTEGGRQKNRRVQFAIVKTKK